MKTVGRISPHLAAGVAGTLVLLAAVSQKVSAQALDSTLRPDGRPTTSSSAPFRPAQSQPVPQYLPLRSGTLLTRPVGPYGASPFAPMPGSSGSPMFQNMRPFGPSAVVPDMSDMQGRTPDLRYRWMRPVAPVGPANGFTNNPLPPVGPANGFFNNSTPPVGPANGFFNNSTPPVGPGNGFLNSGDNRPRRPVDSGNGDAGNGYSRGSDVRITTPLGSQNVPQAFYRNNYVYNTYTVNPIPIIAGAPPLLGGYYYSNYCETSASADTYPSVYSTYDGFPRYIYSPAVVVIGQPAYPVDATSYLPFYTPIYSVTYNQNNYYVATEKRAEDLEAGGDRAQTALHHAYPANSYQAAFGDIARAWMDGTITPLRKHIRNSDTRISVSLNKKYSYSIASGDFVQITRDALDRLNTVSFDFTRLRKAKNGDVTAYGTHVYRVGETGTTGSDGRDGDVVPFDQNGTDSANSAPQTTAPYDKSSDPTSGEEKTVYVSYTLRHRESQWYIIAIDSADQDLAPDK